MYKFIGRQSYKITKFCRPGRFRWSPGYGWEDPKSDGNQVADISRVGIAQPHGHGGWILYDDQSAETVKDVHFITEDETSWTRNHALHLIKMLSNEWPL